MTIGVVAIEPWRGEDLQLLRALNAPEMKRHLGGPETEDQLLTRHGKYVASDGPSARRYRIVHVGRAEAIGSIGYWERDWAGDRIYEMGWSVLPAYQGRGIATAAVRHALAAAAAERTQRYVHAFPSADNHASNSVCKKAGFELIGECDFEYPPGSTKRVNDWAYDLCFPPEAS